MFPRDQEQGKLTNGIVYFGAQALTFVWGQQHVCEIVTAQQSIIKREIGTLAIVTI